MNVIPVELICMSPIVCFPTDIIHVKLKVILFCIHPKATKLEIVILDYRRIRLKTVIYLSLSVYKRPLFKIHLHTKQIQSKSPHTVLIISFKIYRVF